MTPEQEALYQRELAKLLKVSHYCDKCKSLVMTEENLEGKQCCPVAGGHYCDGVLRRATEDDIMGKI